MSLKTKVTSLITTFILLCSLLTVGVFAVKNTTFNVGGDIVFNVQGIEATITRGETAGFTSDKTIGNADGNILSDITLNNDMTADQVAAEFAPWSGLNLAFSDKVATIKLTITNTAQAGADNYLDITALADATTKNNAEITVINDAGGNIALLAPQASATFTITFSVIDDEYSASLEGFSVNFDMQKKVLADFPSYDTVEGMEFECDTTNKTATLTDGFEAVGNVIIPAYVQKDNVICAVTSIGNNAFYGAGFLTLTIPSSVTIISSDAFEACSISTSIIVEEGNRVYDSRNNCNAIIETATNTLIEGCLNTKIPNTVTSIGNYVFDYYDDLKSLIIPGSVTSIGNNAFYDSGLTTVEIPDSVTSIGGEAFMNCASLLSVTIGSGVTSIGNGAFGGCDGLATINYRGTEAQWNALVPNLSAIVSYEVTINYNFKG